MEKILHQDFNNKVTNIKEIDDPLKDVAWTGWKAKRKEYI